MCENVKNQDLEATDQILLLRKFFTTATSIINTHLRDSSSNELRVNDTLILLHLYQHGSSDMTNLVRSTNILAAALTRNARYLEKEGYITLQQSSEDKRSNVLSLTSEGETEAHNIIFYLNNKRQRIERELGKLTLPDLLLKRT